MKVLRAAESKLAIGGTPEGHTEISLPNTTLVIAGVPEPGKCFATMHIEVNQLKELADKR